MSNYPVVEVSFVFRGKDALENSEAFMQHLDTIQGIFEILEGIRHFGGLITCLQDDPEQKLVILDGDMSDEDNSS